MTKTSYVFVVAFLIFVGCQKKEGKETPVPIESVETTVSLGTDCYAFDDGHNAISLRITNITNNKVKGHLRYQLSEKDQNTGTFEGMLQNDTLIASYTFASEGLESKREVAFLVKENQLVEGYGDMDAEGVKFKNRKTLSFTNTMPLAKIPCQGPADCPFEFGFVFSGLDQQCLTISKIETILRPLKNGVVTEGAAAYVVFAQDKRSAEVFLPKTPQGIILEKTSEGNWGSGDYKLTAWKGYVLQYKGEAIFGGQ